MVVRDVVDNTKAYFDNAVKFFCTDTGIRVIFKVAGIANTHVAVHAEGTFAGDEIICLEEEGTNVSAHVSKRNGEGFIDLSKQFKMHLKEVPLKEVE